MYIVVHVKKEARNKKERDAANLKFGGYLRQKREAAEVSLRALATRLDVDPTYLSKVEMGKIPVSERIAQDAARLLGEDADVLYAKARRISSDLIEVIARRPQAFAKLIRQLKESPDETILRVAREVRDGEW